MAEGGDECEAAYKKGKNATFIRFLGAVFEMMSYKNQSTRDL